MTTNGTHPNPGSDEARAEGCRCPMIDNGHGKGRGGDGDSFGWIIRGDCPMHGRRDGNERS